MKPRIHDMSIGGPMRMSTCIFITAEIPNRYIGVLEELVLKVFIWVASPAMGLFFFTLILSCSATVQAASFPSADVRPIIGATTAGSHAGKTFPGADTPFGMVQLSPDTITGGDNGPGYSYPNKTIEGFSFAHMNGVGWYGDLGNLQVMPETGPLIIGRDAAKSPYSHHREKARADYYSVWLNRYSTRVELTAAKHAGMMRITYPASGPHRIKIDLHRRIGGHSVQQFVHLVNPTTVEGWMNCNHSGGGWGHGAGDVDYIIYFYMQFSMPLEHFGIWNHGKYFRHITQKTGRDIIFFGRFGQKSRTVLLKAGISFVSISDAKINLRHDMPGWNFDSVHQAGQMQWNKALDTISIQGGTQRDRIIFYTALYHAMLDPRTFTDVNGDYPDHFEKIHHAKDFIDRTIFSGWDVYRSEFPLLNMIDPDVVNDEVISLMKVNTHHGCIGLPIWEIMGVDSKCMNGSPAISVIANAYLNNIRNYNVARAYKLCREVLLGPKDKSNLQDFSDWQKLGYAPGQLTLSLQTAYFDYCAGRFAQALGKKADARLFFKAAMNYRKLFDPAVDNMRARKADGQWAPWHGLTAWGGQGTTESTPYQNNWFVPQDPQGLIDLMGGRKPFLASLENFFNKTPRNFAWNPYDNQSNEPVAFVPFLFTYAGKPWLTEYWTRFICRYAYRLGPEGLPGNDDCGQTSAWYVLAAMGLHPECPCSNIFILTSPLFSNVTIHLNPSFAKGTSFNIIARNNSTENIYIQSAMLNGHTLHRAWLWDHEITDGGTLVVTMGPTPNKTWASANADLPPSLTTVKKSERHE